MNLADSQRIQAILEELGWQEKSMDEANLVVLNTCSVREAPEVRAHNLLARLRREKLHRPDLLITLMGCMIGNQRTLEALQKKYPYIDLFMKVEQADILPRFLEERWTPLSGSGCVHIMEDSVPTLPTTQLPAIATKFERLQVQNILPMAIVPSPAEKIAHYPTSTFQPENSQTAWLPVILGCNKACTYCIVPYRRGRERSRPIEEILQEARMQAARGVKEVTLLGQTVEAYGLDLPQAPDLADLMEQLSEIQELQRIRFMTSYPRHMTNSMIARMAELPKVCEHINIPIQSGADSTLLRMKRGYTIAEYLDRIETLRHLWPKVTLSTDVIVGFCEETDAEFQETLYILRTIKFDLVHVAAYSPRSGTLSARWEDTVPMEVKKARLHEVEIVEEEIAMHINQSYVGSIQEVLIESHHESRGEVQWKGRNRANKLVFSQHVKEVCPGMMVQVMIDHATAWSLQGSLIESENKEQAA
jgi:tRNA-2-methylthio-N6-dimethylallyladenosine synthase